MTATESDWFAQAFRQHQHQELRASQLSSAWSREARRADELQDMIRIREVVRDLLRVHGVPKQCRIDLAVIGDQGAGAAGFEDAPASFEKPFIRLDKGLYKRCATGDVLDVYCGIALHEAGHIKHTREFYRRQRHDRPRLRRLWENLWEDERIEELSRQEAPGFAPYLQVARREILQHGELGAALANWDALPDMDKVQALAFAFVRCAHLITEEMQTWSAINGERVFETLRALFPAGPRDEADVEEFALRLHDLYNRLQKLYADASAGPNYEDAASAERVRRQRMADAEDRDLEKPGGDEPPAPSEAVEQLLEDAANLEASGRPEQAEDLLQQALQLEERGDAAAGRAGRRFSMPDLERVLDQMNTIAQPLDAEESETLRELEIDPGSQNRWSWGMERNTVVNCPAPTAEARQSYREAERDVRDHVSAMRAIFFGIRSGSRVHYENERSEGRLHARRLGRAALSDRLYRRKCSRDDPGLALGLLLDESGSMLAGAPSRAWAALRVAVLVAESLKDVPGIELEIYAHTSCGPADRDCLVRCLYGKRNQDRLAIGCYGLGSQNYDHQALQTVARLFEEATHNEERVLLVVSDGAPVGHDYGGEPAIQATREAVNAIRQRGMTVLNVALEDYQSEEIFGARHVVKLENLADLVKNMRGLVTGIVKQVTQGR